jgi:hypothetical protein
VCRLTCFDSFCLHPYYLPVKFSLGIYVSRSLANSRWTFGKKNNQICRAKARIIEGFLLFRRNCRSS